MIFEVGKLYKFNATMLLVDKSEISKSETYSKTMLKPGSVFMVVEVLPMTYSLAEPFFDNLGKKFTRLQILFENKLWYIEVFPLELKHYEKFGE